MALQVGALGSWGPATLQRGGGAGLPRPPEAGTPGSRPPEAWVLGSLSHGCQDSVPSSLFSSYL